jgi:lipoate-protein ligase B
MVARNTAVADAVARGEAAAEIAFFEPDAPVYALGRRAQDPAARARIAGSLAACAARQIAIVDVDRGGLGTLHAPGQIVAFLAVPCPRWQARELCADLLRGIKQLARDSGVDARCDLADDVGVWSPAGKLASLGLRLRDDVAQHGVALNIAVDPRLGQGLVLCGKPWIELANLTDPAAQSCASLATWSRALAEQWQLQLNADDDGGFR